MEHSLREARRNIRERDGIEYQSNLRNEFRRGHGRKNRH